MPVKSLNDLAERRRPARSRFATRTPTDAEIKNKSQWLKYGILLLMAYYILQYLFQFSPWNIDKCSRISYCNDSNSTSTHVQSIPLTTSCQDWQLIKNWPSFVDECTINAPKSNNPALRNGYQGTSSVAMDFIGETRCATTAYGLIRYFCGSDNMALASGVYIPHFDDKTGKQLGTLDSFIKEMEYSEYDGHESFFELHINQNWDNYKVGHVWVLQRHENGTYRWYQSFINKYTLQQWMKKEEEKQNKQNERVGGDGDSDGAGLLSKNELFERLDKIRVIVSSDVWDNNVNNAYFELFDVNMKHLMGKTMTPSIFGKGNGYDNSVSFEWSIKCVDPLKLNFEKETSKITQKDNAQFEL